MQCTQHLKIEFKHIKVLLADKPEQISGEKTKGKELY